jgi:hypothetical protein
MGSKYENEGGIGVKDKNKLQKKGFEIFLMRFSRPYFVFED